MRLFFYSKRERWSNFSPYCCSCLGRKELERKKEGKGEEKDTERDVVCTTVHQLHKYLFQGTENRKSQQKTLAGSDEMVIIPTVASSLCSYIPKLSQIPVGSSKDPEVIWEVPKFLVQTLVQPRTVKPSKFQMSYKVYSKFISLSCLSGFGGDDPPLHHVPSPPCSLVPSWKFQFSCHYAIHFRIYLIPGCLVLAWFNIKYIPAVYNLNKC